MGKTTVYKANRFYNLIILVFPFLLTLPLFIANNSPTKNKLIGLAGFWLIGIILAFAPFFMKLEVTEGAVRSFFLGFCTKELKASDIKSLTYSNLFVGGLGFGKGLIIRAAYKGVVKRFSIGERLYGKEAIEHIRRVLRPRSSVSNSIP